MKFKSQVYTETSGSIGGITYSHNRGGLYTRARAIPVQPNTTQQQAVKGYFAQLAARWFEVLTQAQRDAWSAYSAAVPMPGPLGDLRDIGGRQMFQAANVLRLQSSLSVVDAGPVELYLPTFTAPTIAADASDDDCDVTFTNTDDWAGEVGGAMLIYISRPTNQGVLSFKGPYRYAGKIAGAVSPPSSPATLTLPFPIGSTNRLYAKVGIVRADGRFSSPFRLGCTVAA